MIPLQSNILQRANCPRPAISNWHRLVASEEGRCKVLLLPRGSRRRSGPGSGEDSGRPAKGNQAETGDSRRQYVESTQPTFVAHPQRRPHASNDHHGGGGGVGDNGSSVKLEPG